MNFQDLNLIEPIRMSLIAEGYQQPTPIQAQSIPHALEGRDILGCAQTGTGKTAAFSIPILQLLHKSQNKNQGKRPIRALILTPTRELAIQIGESLSVYGKNLNLRHLVIFGGVPQGAQARALREGVDILVATPGRLLDLISQRLIRLDQISFFVLDEADRMLDMGFIHDINKVIGMLPAKRQTLFFSATMPTEIRKLSGSILTNPVQVAVTPVSSTAERVDQSIYFVDKADKKKLLVHLLKHTAQGSTLVFTRTKHGADKVVKDLAQAKIYASAIHGNKSQNARQHALNQFKSGDLRVLVATDIAARGIDVEALSHVINYDLPDVPETYVHRIGRTGRAGATGKAISFCDREEKDQLKQIIKLPGIVLTEIEDHPFPTSASDIVRFTPPKNKDVVMPAGRVVNPSTRRNSGFNGKRQKPRGVNRPETARFPS